MFGPLMFSDEISLLINTVRMILAIMKTESQIVAILRTLVIVGFWLSC